MGWWPHDADRQDVFVKGRSAMHVSAGHSHFAVVTMEKELYTWAVRHDVTTLLYVFKNLQYNKHNLLRLKCLYKCFRLPSHMLYIYTLGR